jgi:spore coat protein CotH
MSITFKRHYRLLLTLALVVGVLIALFPDARIVAYTVAGSQEPPEYVINYDNSVALFDDTVVHEVVVLISEEEREKMVTTFQETGQKDYFPADVIIDGVRINKVGIRLKGNASLRSLDGMFGRPGFGGNRPRFGDGGFPTSPFGDGENPFGESEFPVPPFDGEGDRFGDGGFPTPSFGDGENPFGEDEFPVPPSGDEENPLAMGKRPFGDRGMPMGAGGMPFGGGGETSRVPYLIKLDEYVEGQRYQGYAKIALRTSGMSYDAAQLQEPVSNYVFNSVGVPIAETAYISLQFNDEEPQLYTIAEEVDQVYIDRILPDSDGVLYKVQQVGNSFSYLGEDPTLYDRVFEQKTAVNDTDLAPLIDFLRFVSQSTDEEFARDLPQWLDVDAFASYLAVNNLLVNYDSLAGMGNNYYLYYDYDEERFTILAWDTNESLGKISMGGRADLDLYWQAVGGRFGRMFDDAEPSEGETAPADDQPNAGGGNPRGPAGPMGRGNHLLKERFLDTPEFLALYEEKLLALYQQVFLDDLLTAKIEEYAALVTAYNQEHSLVDQTAYDAAVQDVLDFVAQRHAYLGSTELLGQP